MLKGGKMIKGRMYMKVAYGFLVFLVLALVALWVLSICGVLHWLVAVVGTLGSSGCIVTVLASIKQYRELNTGAMK